VRHALKRESTGLVLGGVKTATSRRAVNLPLPLVATLAAHRKRQAESQLAASEWTTVISCSRRRQEAHSIHGTFIALVSPLPKERGSGGGTP